MITRMDELRSEAQTVEHNMLTRLEYPTAMINNIYKNSNIEILLNEQYEKPIDYYTAYSDFHRNSLIESWMGRGDESLVIYADNDTILNGGMFYKLEAVREEGWYKRLGDTKGNVLMFDYGKGPSDVFSERRVLILRKLDKARAGTCEKVLKMELNYKQFVDTILSDSVTADVYLCQDEKLLMSNVGESHYRESYSFIDTDIKYDYIYRFSYSGNTYTLYMKSRDYGFSLFANSMLPVIIILVIINIMLPFAMMKALESSVTGRIEDLNYVFESSDAESLTKIENVEGSDEIHDMMVSYNSMADRMNDLIQTVYIDKVKAQEMDIARQNAELLALHSQINPHFLFNALESIRMHSILKNEKETAEMVEHLAMMERANVNWQSDIVTVNEEMKFIESYLTLQKYRFGDRLNYDFDVDASLGDFRIPKLSLVTFVENACVHGIECDTAQGWIFVRIFRDGDDAVFEIEDTGRGIPPEKIELMLYRMNNASIEMLKTETSVGMINACLRIKMMTDENARFSIESEPEIGTTIQIKLKAVEKAEKVEG